MTWWTHPDLKALRNIVQPVTALLQTDNPLCFGSDQKPLLEHVVLFCGAVFFLLRVRFLKLAGVCVGSSQTWGFSLLPVPLALRSFLVSTDYATVVWYVWCLRRQLRPDLQQADPDHLLAEVP
ncbi:hypothetical protein AK812_SmicGene42708 [Symbiodinium microadriaticum]|uniref:Uncharacterized protein n=1 Tax=Symbiodinium microadriaticum TaxID=2951 RepID=A0A1Q9C2U8_SYMMI|nr:hypothetical protein AK812_SmicGene42708 [Symbiodinium microadriaticum]